MKKILVLVTFLMLSVGVASFTVGCANKTPQAIAYQTLSATKLTVDKAVDAFIDFDILHGAKKADREKVAQLNDRFNMAFAQAVVIASMDYNAVTPEEVRKIASDLVLLISTIQKN